MVWRQGSHLLSQSLSWCLTLLSFKEHVAGRLTCSLLTSWCHLLLHVQHYFTSTGELVQCYVHVHVSCLGGAPPQGPTPYPLIYHFWQERYPFHKPTGKWYLFHMSTLEICIPFNCCKCSVFWLWINHKTRLFYRPCHCHKVKPFLQTKVTDLPTFHIIKLVKSLPLHIHVHVAWKRHPFG